MDDWIHDLEDVTALAHEIHALVRAGELAAAQELLPEETAYPLPAELAVSLSAAPGQS